MARLFRKLATLATAAEAARRYARSNPDQAGRYVDQAAAFVDKQTKGKYRTQIDGVARKAKGAAGIATPAPGTTPPATTNGYEAGWGQPDSPARPTPEPRTPGA